MSDKQLTESTGFGRRINPVIVGLCTLGFALAGLAFAQTEDQPKPDQPPVAQTPAETPDDAPDSQQQPNDAGENANAAGNVALDPTETDTSEEIAALAPAAPTEPKDPKTLYGLATIIPAIVAILLAIFTRQVVPALVVGVLVAAYMMVPCLPASHPYAGGNAAVVGFRLAAESYIFGAIINPADGHGHLKIIFFTLVIGFMVGVIGRNGGTEGMVQLVAGESRSRRRGALTAWFAGLVVFFDDYANTMIVGPTMRPIFDRLKLSRAKLAYIVDSTAAPVASLALIGTWVGAEVGFINLGLSQFNPDTAPAFLLTDNGQVIQGMTAFINSLPYRFYPILALLLVLLVALTGRDFGPMKRAERRTLSKIDPDESPATTAPTSSAKVKPRWWLGLAPVLVLMAATIGVLVATGLQSNSTVEAMQAVDATGANTWATQAWWEKASTVVGNADSYLSIFYGAILAVFAAVLLTIVARACPTRDAIDAGLEGMSRIFPAVVILVLAWSLSAVLGELELGTVVAERLKAAEFNPTLLPLAVFACAAGISFATGSSWGTMGILCPMTVEVAVRLMTGIEQPVALNLFYASVGSVLAGSIFGDHCSPISDTTVLSSLASGCRHEEHVWTQLPYALITAVAAMGLGDVMCSYYHQPWYYGLGAGAIFLVLWIYIVGRRAVPSFELADA